MKHLVKSLLPLLCCAELWAAESKIIAPNETLQKLAGDFVFTEGPACDAQGNVFFTERKYADAVLNYQNSIKRDPNFAEAFYRLGLAQLKIGAGQQAYESLRRAVELAPDRENFRVELGDLVLESYQRDRRKPKVLYDQLADNAKYLLVKNASSFDGLRLTAAVMSIDGKFDEALIELRKANEVQPLNPKAEDDQSDLGGDGLCQAQHRI